MPSKDTEYHQQRAKAKLAELRERAAAAFAGNSVPAAPIPRDEQWRLGYFRRPRV